MGGSSKTIPNPNINLHRRDSRDTGYSGLGSTRKKKVQVRRRDQSGQGQVAFGVLGDSTPFPQNANLTETNHHFPKHLPIYAW